MCTLALGKRKRERESDRSSISLEDLLQHCGVEEACLKEVTFDSFLKISPYLSQWKLLAPMMNISQAEVDEIKNESADMQRISFLGKWKKMSMRATYRVLVDSLLSIGRVDDARGVCNILKGKCVPY